MKAEQVKSLREKEGLTQEQLAKKLGVSKWRVVNWERPTGKVPVAMQTLMRMMFNG